MQNILNIYNSHKTLERSLTLEDTRVNPIRNQMKLTTTGVTQMNTDFSM